MFEDHLAHGKKSKKVNGRGKRRDKPIRCVPEKPSFDDVSKTPLLEIEESFNFSEKDDKVVVIADDDVEERDTEKYKVEECEEDNKEEEMVKVQTMVAATTNNNTPVSGFFFVFVCQENLWV